MSEDQEQYLQILDYQKPGLESGSYRVKIGQSIKLRDEDNLRFEEKEFCLHVTGDRFRLGEDAVHACFPPEGSLGNYADVLPHISLSRSTLPWERSAYGNEDYEPWVALLVFDESELLSGEVIEQSMPLGELIRGHKKVLLPDQSEKKASFPMLKLEPGQLESDQVDVINVKKSLLKNVLPSRDELKLLSHVRKRTAPKSKTEPEWVTLSELAVVVANRLPKEGSETSVYLVSVESRYNPADSNEQEVFNFGDAKNEDDYVRLICLRKWGFACLSDIGENFEKLAAEIQVGMFCWPNPAKSSSRSTQIETYRDAYLEAGYVPLPHRLRQADQTYSWYRGPFSPHETSPQFFTDSDLPDFADELVTYNTTIGMFDVSYAAAFELGKMLSLEDIRFSTNLYEWKQDYNEKILAKLEGGEIETIFSARGAAGILAATIQKASLSLSAPEEDIGADERFDFIKEWLFRLKHLQGVPYNYLVPDGEMLPREAFPHRAQDSYRALPVTILCPMGKCFPGRQFAFSGLISAGSNRF